MATSRKIVFELTIDEGGYTLDVITDGVFFYSGGLYGAEPGGKHIDPGSATVAIIDKVATAINRHFEWLLSARAARELDGNRPDSG